MYRPLRVLVGCEFSGIVRDAFIRYGHYAVSCDLLPTDRPHAPHIVGDVRDAIKLAGWDLAIFHPPCTHLSVSGARWFKYKQAEQAAALEFVRVLLNSDIPYIALENPVSVISSAIRRPTQTVQPWMFGHPERKATCLWLKNLPCLLPTQVVPENLRNTRIHMMPDTKDRWKKRSTTFHGIADAMAVQWGAHIKIPYTVVEMSFYGMLPSINLFN